MAVDINKPISILYPYSDEAEYTQLSPLACHDLALDTLCATLAQGPKEDVLIMGILSKLTTDTRVAEYRQKVFVDILNLPELRKKMMELLDKISYIKDFKTMKRGSSERMGLWDLLHKLDEISDYIKCVEAMQECLGSADLKSQGLLDLREYINAVYTDSFFAEMKADIEKVKAEASSVKSVTVGINVNERFEASSLGLISINDTPFKKSGIVSNFADALKSRNKLHEGTDWDGDMHYTPAEAEDEGSGVVDRLSELYSKGTTGGIIMRNVANAHATTAAVPKGDGVESTTFYLGKIVTKLLDTLVKKLRDTLGKYVNVAVMNISKLIPEFVFYIRFAEFIEGNLKKGMPFCEASILSEKDLSDGFTMKARGLYNLKLAISSNHSEEIVYNDLDFDADHTVYILTGANRGGKTTITQAVGLLFVLAQSGIYVPASSFEYKPVDNILTHFPADEDKTMDLGRLGEECVRFKELYTEATEDSLMLLNETFSTTSFEEGYYIARDSVRAILKKGIRTIYNTHMHKLAYDVDTLNEGDAKVKASSLIVKNEGPKRSFKVEVAPPEGMSFAKDIAEKYGVTYEMLTE
ncbi:MAG: DNA mismatch repair protein [Clostridiales bacterium]|nr:DNA mismatch repair protein [Clostridiales bacterium]